MTIAEIAAHFSKDKQKTKLAVEKEIRESTVVTLLIKIRHDRGMTQTDVAKQMGCHVSKVSRIESGTDAQLNLVDLSRYSAAIGVRSTFLFEPDDMHSSLLIKHYVFGIKARLEHLAEIARGSEEGDEVSKKIQIFFGEVLINFLKGFGDVFSTLPQYEKKGKARKSKTVSVKNSAVKPLEAARL
jgi:transcriptional regulator with XRE-family HTH domain